MQHRVSVIIPTYNRSQLLRKTIQSVLDQTYSDYEIIVVNNSSKDDTKGMIASLKDDRIKVYDIDNCGVIAKSRNLGLKMSGGEYVAFLDDDDLWLPEKLEKQVAYLDKHPEYSLVYGEVQVIDENDERKEYRKLGSGIREGDVFLELVNGNFIDQLTVMMRREVIGEVGYFNEDSVLRSVEDYEYWLRVSLKHKFGCLAELLGLYRVHSAGASKNVNDAALNQKVLESVLRDFPSAPGRGRILERINNLNLKSAIHNWKNSDKKASKEDMGRYLNWSLEHRRILNIFKAAGLYFLLLSGAYKPLLSRPKAFRRFIHG